MAAPAGDRPIDAVVAGHICLDVFPDLAATAGTDFLALLRPGQLVQVGKVGFSTGGPVSNTGLALHKLGIRTRLMGKVGDDLFGSAVRQIVGTFGSDLAGGMVVDPAADTSYTIILSAPGLDRIFLHAPAANNTFTAEDVRYDVVAQARLFHFGYPPLMRRMFEAGGEQLEAVFRRVKALGVTTSLDMAVPDPASEAGRADWRAILGRTLPYVDVFLPSIEETLFVLRRETHDALVAGAGGSSLLPLVTPELLSDVSGELLEMGAKIVGLKLGSRGLYVRTGDAVAIESLGAARPAGWRGWASREAWAPCFQVDMVGTTGSGDATIAGFLSALLRGYTFPRAVSMAVAVGACNVEAFDALSGIRSWEATEARIAAGWARREERLSSAGWSWDPGVGLWEKA